MGEQAMIGVFVERRQLLAAEGGKPFGPDLHSCVSVAADSLGGLAA